MSTQSQRHDSENVARGQHISEAEIKLIAREAAEMAIGNLFEIFGVDTTTKEGRKGLQDDFTWVRDARVGTASLRKAGWLAGAGTIGTAIIYALWKGIVALTAMGKAP